MEQAETERTASERAKIGHSTNVLTKNPKAATRKKQNTVATNSRAARTAGAIAKSQRNGSCVELKSVVHKHRGGETKVVQMCKLSMAKDREELLQPQTCLVIALG